ncbi:yippee zinc-binding/DNA-binding /Mis18, centromere assembly-domain-containing protein [Dipodascopsis tothii]|uniref:yippee zinc-binding/DNA-binding /Mis18, centromere assembly-domain-containing protein n=1 Tax=Dipodascopsis tothii TaxID=44089 RepID=UPI0034CE2B2E
MGSPNPIVFQCGQCLRIVADSSSWVCATADLGTFTLEDVAGDAVARSDSLSTSHDGADLGSTFTEFACRACTAPLGRIYRTTPRALDAIRDLFTFYTHSVRNYQVGVDGGAEQTPTDADLAVLRPSPDRVARRMAIMETLLMDMHDELGALRARVAVLETAAAAPRAGRPRKYRRK